MEIIKKIQFCSLCVSYLLCLLSCKQQVDHIDTATIERISNHVIDSIGELAYDHYAAYEKNPANFIEPLENKELDPDQREAYLWILINMAYGFQEHSRHIQSTAYYEKALVFDKQNQVLTKPEKLNFIYKALANNYTVLADYVKAERILNEAIQESTDALTKASFYNNLVILFRANGQTEKSRDYGKLGLSYATDSTYLKVLLHNSLAESYELLDKVDSAYLHNSTALQLCKQLNSPELKTLAEISSYNQLGVLLLKDKRYSDAEKNLKTALSLENNHFPKTRNREKAAIYHKLGEGYLLQKQLSKAENYYHKGLKHHDVVATQNQTSNYTKVNLLKGLGIVHALQRQDSAWFYFRQAVESDFAYQQQITTKASHLRGNLWNRQILEEIFSYLDLKENQASLSQEQLSTLLWMTELTKGRLLWNDISRSNYWNQQQDSSANTINQLQLLYAERDQTDDSTKLEEIHTETERLLTEFELEENYFSRPNTLPDYEEFLNSLSDERGMIYAYYIHLDQSISIFQNTAGKLQYWSRHSAQLIDSLNLFKQRYFTTSPQAYNENPQDYVEFASRLQKQLLPNLSTKETTLKLSLDNELFTIPFDALYHEKQFLAEQTNIQYINSLLIPSLYKQKDFGAKRLQILYRGEYEPPQADLQFVAEEVNKLNRHFKANLHPYTELSSQTLRTVFNQDGIVHIAAHATIDPQLNARLLLNHPISSDQLRYFNMQAPLVVLSACNTASGQLLLSEGLESINRAFLSNGVKGVVSTHWFANDAAMLSITEKFYQQLSISKRPVLALAEAKREYLSVQTEAGKNPWYWANMAYMGADIKVDLQQAAGLDSIIFGIASAGVLLILFLIWFFKKRIRDPKN